MDIINLKKWLCPTIATNRNMFFDIVERLFCEIASKNNDIQSHY